MFDDSHHKANPKSKKKRVQKFAEGGTVALPKDDPREAYRGARRDIRSTPPVTVMEDLVGRFSDSKGQNNALRDAIREKAFKTIKESGYENK